MIAALIFQVQLPVLAAASPPWGCWPSDERLAGTWEVEVKVLGVRSYTWMELHARGAIEWFLHLEESEASPEVQVRGWGCWWTEADSFYVHFDEVESTYEALDADDLFAAQGLEYRLEDDRFVLIENGLETVLTRARTTGVSLTAWASIKRRTAR